MEITGLKHLEKLKRKNKGNAHLIAAIDKLILDLEENEWHDRSEMVENRPDADCVHDNFYFFDIHIHRTMILVEFEDGEVTIVWCGGHDEYETTFRNNKKTIEKWLRRGQWI